MITASSLNDGYHHLNNPTTQQQRVIVQPDSLLMNNNSSYSTMTSSIGDTVPELIAENSHSSNSTITTTGGGGGTGAEEEPAVYLPTTYATLPPTTKLEEEPNPFEQSFEKIKLPSVKQQPQPERWDSLMSGIPSPSMLAGPPTQTTVVRRPIKHEVERTTFYNHMYENPPPTVNRAQVKNTRKMSSVTATEEGNYAQKNKRQKRNNSSKNSIKDPEDEEKRKSFLERNRIAALKCRQRKKQWLQNLQTKVEYLAADNEQFHMQANALREELINLKTLLMAHKDCPINQQDMKLALSRPIPDVPSLPYLLNSTSSSGGGYQQQGQGQEHGEEEDREGNA